MSHFLLLTMYLVLMLLVVSVPRILNRFHIPAVVAIMLTGIIIGPNACDLLNKLTHIIPGNASASDFLPVIDALGWLGLVFLMALAGMEVDLRMLTLERRPVVWLSILTFAIPSLAGYFVYAYFRPEDEIRRVERFAHRFYEQGDQPQHREHDQKAHGGDQQRPAQRDGRIAV